VRQTVADQVRSPLLVLYAVLTIVDTGSRSWAARCPNGSSGLLRWSAVDSCGPENSPEMRRVGPTLTDNERIRSAVSVYGQQVEAEPADRDTGRQAMS
jgi:hypothetical protein